MKSLNVVHVTHYVRTNHTNHVHGYVDENIYHNKDRDVPGWRGGERSCPSLKATAASGAVCRSKNDRSEVLKLWFPAVTAYLRISFDHSTVEFPENNICLQFTRIWILSLHVFFFFSRASITSRLPVERYSHNTDDRFKNLCFSFFLFIYNFIIFSQRNPDFIHNRKLWKKKITN